MSFKFLRKMLELGIVAVIFVLVLSATTGHAFVPLGGQGKIMVPGNHQADIEFVLNEKSPNLIQTVIITFQSNTPLDESGNVSVSLDSGSTWYRCEFFKFNTWYCSFSSDNAPQVYGIKDVRVLISS